MQKAKEIGMDAYHAEQREKMRILNQLLDMYDDGDKAAFFCLAVNRIEVEELQKILSQLDERCANMSLSDKADLAETMLRECEKIK